MVNALKDKKIAGATQGQIETMTEHAKIHSLQQMCAGRIVTTILPPFR